MKHILLITTGGSDLFNIAGQLVKKVKQLPDTAQLNFHIVAGRFNQHIPMLEQLAADYSGIIIHRSVQKMSDLMLSCDLAVSAGGSTMYELCACGTPTICFAWADNQMKLAESFRQYIFSVGDIRSDTDRIMNQILAYIIRLSSDMTMREVQSERMQALVDGNGAEYIAEKLKCELSF